MLDLIDTTTSELYSYQREEIQYPRSTVFSDYIVTNKYEIDNGDMRIIHRKLERSMKFDKNWNGENTFPPSGKSIFVTRYLLDFYNNFIKANSINPAGVQIYPLNEGGFGLELITQQPTMIFRVENDSLNQDDSKPIIHYYITDETTEESGEINISHLSSLFLRFHILNRDV